jgi:hypothetical protein
MTDHYDEMRVSPEPSQAAELRIRLHERLASVSGDHQARSDLQADTAHLEPAQLVPSREIDVSLDADTNETTNRRRMVMAAAAVIVVIGVTGIAFALTSPNADDDPTPSPTAVATGAPTTSVAPPTTVAPAVETVRFEVIGADIPVTLAVPAGWTIEEQGAAKGVGVGEVGVHFDVIPNLYADGCQWEPVDPPVGPTVDDLVTAWANLPQYAATAAVDVTVDGYAGKQIEFTVPDYTISDCRRSDGPMFGLWKAPDHAFPGFWAQGPDQHHQQLILDVDGTRLVITAYYVPSPSEQDRAALDEVLASIQIG